MDLRTKIVAALQNIDVERGLGVSADDAADVIVRPAVDELFSDNIQDYIDERIAALEMHAQKKGASKQFVPPTSMTQFLQSSEPAATLNANAEALKGVTEMIKMSRYARSTRAA